MELWPTAVLDTAVEGLLVVDRAGRFTYANPAAEKILGRPAAQLASSSFRSWKTTAVDGAPLPPEELPVFRVIRTGEACASAEHVLERADGTSAVVAHTATLIRDEKGAVEGAVASLLDITDRARGGEGTRRRELTFRSFVERSPEGVVLYRDGHVVYANPTLRRMLGYERLDEVVGRSVYDFVHPDDRAIVRDRIDLLMEDDVEVPAVANRLLHRNGHAIDVEASARAIGYEGESTVLAIVVDVSERTRILKQLDQKHELLANVIDHAPVGICLLRGPDLVYELVNPMYEAIYGKKLRIGRSFAEVGPDPTGELGPVLRRVLETGEPHHSVDVAHPTSILRGKETEQAYLWLTYLRVPSERGAGVLALVVDTTEQVEARRRIEELAAVAQRQAAEIRGIHESMLDSVMVCDARAIVTHVNEAFSRLTGLEGALVVGRSLDAYATLAASHDMEGEPLSASGLALGRALRGETLFHFGSWSMRTGRKVFIRCNAAPIRNAAGELVGAVAVERDVSDVIDFDAMKDQFIRVAAHELKTPVAIMKGYAELLLRCADQFPPALVGGVEAIDRGAKRIDRLVGDLLGVSQLLMGRMQLRLERLDLSELVDVVTRQVALTTKRHQVRVVETEPVVVQGDRMRLAQVLDTLLDNAVRYSPRGGDIDVSVVVRDHEAEVCVRDHGVGIPREKQAGIFERFYRAHTDTPHDYGGMGVGLYIAREIIAQHGGTIGFESEEGRGSKFCFSVKV